MPGIVKDELHEDWEAAKFFRYALDCSDRISHHVKHVCVHRLGQIYSRQGDSARAEAITGELISPFNNPSNLRICN